MHLLQSEWLNFVVCVPPKKFISNFKDKPSSEIFWNIR